MLFIIKKQWDKECATDKEKWKTKPWCQEENTNKAKWSTNTNSKDKSMKSSTNMIPIMMMSSLKAKSKICYKKCPITEENKWTKSNSKSTPKDSWQMQISKQEMEMAESKDNNSTNSLKDSDVLSFIS